MRWVSRAGPRATAIEARLSGDPALQANIKLWQENFVAVDLAAGRQAPPAGLFEMIVCRPSMPAKRSFRAR